jgi:GNAT superfamily N-acetyltransferase
MPTAVFAPPLGLTVRLAVAGDVDALVGLLGDCVREMHARGLDQWDDVYPSRATLEADVEAGTLTCATRGPTAGAGAGAVSVLGAFTLNPHQDPEYAEIAWQISAQPIAVVHRLMVHPAVQRHGLGRFLMRHAERAAHDLGFGALRLDTLLANDRALALYQGLGYHDAGRVTFRKGRFACFEKALEPAG